MTDETQITLTVPQRVDMTCIVGQSDEILHLIEDSFAARITVRGNMIDLVGSQLEVQSLTALFSDLIKMLEDGSQPNFEYVRHAIDLLRTAEFSPQALREDILLTYRGRAIRPKTAGQKRYVDAIRTNTITFGIGPAGTGKTYLAMAMAVAALKRKEVGRIILTRPIVEAGENLGYLPGTLIEKVDPYIRPLYDALFDMTDMERASQLIESGVIEIAPLAFMRGRTLNDSFIILDEAQNTTPEQMKMFLTRLGFGSKIVITGDATQFDLPQGKSGLMQVESILGGLRDIAFCNFTGKDIVRHSLVAAIVAAYDKAEKSKAEKAKSKEGRAT
ncbi:MAG: PhoH family protein [Eggerthellaceae bacterium]|jgi:phosphate starvation-inducible PhoH-like protein|nr:PhoH family protein [Eggerthellaceae bacterium]MDR2721552.1 PhoH family protein [Coriobacteriaceae bacterium]